MKRIVIISLTLVLLSVTFFSGVFIPKHVFVATTRFVQQYFKTDFYQENLLLKLQNEDLKAQLQRVKDGDSEPPNRQPRLEAHIFSTYPFNMKDTIVIDRGSDDGVAPTMAVVVSDSILLGQVMSVDRHTATVRTVFDSHWQLPVRIGSDNVNGLFEGGTNPSITLVEKSIKVGDGVFSAAKEFPMGIKIGDVDTIQEDAGGIFKAATIRTPYTIGDITTVSVLQ